MNIQRIITSSGDVYIDTEKIALVTADTIYMSNGTTISSNIYDNLPFDMGGKLKLSAAIVNLSQIVGLVGNTLYVLPMQAITVTDADVLLVKAALTNPLKVKNATIIKPNLTGLDVANKTLNGTAVDLKDGDEPQPTPTEVTIDLANYTSTVEEGYNMYTIPELILANYYTSVDLPVYKIVDSTSSITGACIKFNSGQTLTQGYGLIIQCDIDCVWYKYELPQGGSLISGMTRDEKMMFVWTGTGFQACDVFNGETIIDYNDMTQSGMYLTYPFENNGNNVITDKTTSIQDASNIYVLLNNAVSDYVIIKNRIFSTNDATINVYDEGEDLTSLPFGYIGDFMKYDGKWHVAGEDYAIYSSQLYEGAVFNVYPYYAGFYFSELPTETYNVNVVTYTENQYYTHWFDDTCASQTVPSGTYTFTIGPTGVTCETLGISDLVPTSYTIDPNQVSAVANQTVTDYSDEYVYIMYSGSWDTDHKADICMKKANFTYNLDMTGLTETYMFGTEAGENNFVTGDKVTVNIIGGNNTIINLRNAAGEYLTDTVEVGSPATFVCQGRTDANDDWVFTREV